MQFKFTIPFTQIVVGAYTLPVVRISFSNGHVEQFIAYDFTAKEDGGYSWNVPTGKNSVPMKFKPEDVVSIFIAKHIRYFGIIPKSIL